MKHKIGTFLAACATVCGFAGQEKGPELISTPVDTVGALVPNGIPCIEDPYFYTTFEFFWGKSRTYGAEVAETQSTRAIANNGTITSYKHYNQSFDWGPGFTVGIGYNIMPVEWDVYFNFLYFSETSGTSVDGGDVLITRISPAVPGNNTAFSYSENATGTFQTDMYTYELELGKSFFTSKNMSIRGHIGGMIADIKQTQTIQHNELKESIASDTVSAYLKNTISSKFFGLGPRMGLNLNYYFRPTWYLFSEPSGALLAGKFKLNMEQEYSSNGSKFIDTSAFNQYIPQVDLNFGLGYGDFFHDERIYVAARIGYQMSYYWNQFIRYDMTSALNELDYDMSLQRYFIDLKFDF